MESILHIMRFFNIRVVRKAVFLLALLLSLQACTSADEEQDKFEQEANSEPEGYTETNRNGNIQQEDPDDWRIAPLFSGNIEVNSPVYPNPYLPGSGNVEINFWVSSDNAIHGLQIYGISYSGREVQLLFPTVNKTLETGSRTYSFNPQLLSDSGNLPEGLYRILVYDGDFDLITYGDLMIR